MIPFAFPKALFFGLVSGLEDLDDALGLFFPSGVFLPEGLFFPLATDLLDLALPGLDPGLPVVLGLFAGVGVGLDFVAVS